MAQLTPAGKAERAGRSRAEGNTAVLGLRAASGTVPQIFVFGTNIGSG
jgi:hypothetical protein